MPAVFFSPGALCSVQCSGRTCSEYVTGYAGIPMQALRKHLCLIIAADSLQPGAVTALGSAIRFDCSV